MDLRTSHIIDVWRSFSGEPDVAKLLQVVVHTAEAVTGAQTGFVILEGKSWSRLEYRFAAEEEIRMLQMLHQRLGTPVIGIITRNSVKLKVDKPDSTWEVSRTLDPERQLSQKIEIGDQHLGTLYLSGKPGGFTNEDQEFLTAFIDQVKAAIERQLYRERMMKMERRLNAIFDAIADGILVLDQEGLPVMWNRSFGNMFFPDGVENHALSSMLPALIDSEKDQGVQEIVLLKPHEEVVSGHFVVTRNETGKKMETVVSLRNVTQIRRQEQRFLQLMAMVVHRIHKRLRAIPPCLRRKGLNRYRRIRRLTRNLIYLTEIKSGPLRISKGPNRLGDLVQMIEQRAKRMFTRRNLALNISRQIDEKAFLTVDSGILKDAFSAVFSFVARKLKAESTCTIRLFSEAEKIKIDVRAPFECWKVLPNPDHLNWLIAIDYFLAEDKRPFLLEMPFARHIFESHKGALDLVSDSHDAGLTMMVPLEI
ncbi:MAG TPA: PAS domain S-box protein [Candidatus Ozemobacteraceae bacterium]|nr:PAS domain S-box protein [Candidatus Ozemobacteraceae bacterium]